MFIFGRKKRKRKQELDEAFKRVIDGIHGLDDGDDPRKIEHYILDACEHIITVAKEMEADKTQYKMLLEHFGDVDKIINMPPEMKVQLAELVDSVGKLTKRKKAYKESEKRLPDEEFAMLSEHEETIVEDINRLRENEIYRDKVDAEVKNLEAEKSRWEIEKDYISNIMGKLRMVSIGIFGVVLCMILASIFIPNVNTIRLPLLIVMFAGVAAAFVIFLFMGMKRKEYRVAFRKLNQTITLLNVERMRYANVCKAIKYETDVYDVKSAAELTYLWEQYVLSVKELEAYRKNNLDLTYFVEKLYKLFKRLDLKYERRWIEQVELMLSEEEMTDLKNKLTERMNKLTDHITENGKIVADERKEIDRMMKEHDFYVPEVMEIISSVDKLCGKNVAVLKEEKSA